MTSVQTQAALAPTGASLYARFALAGAICCGVTHGALTPVDVVKTRIQLEPTVYNKIAQLELKLEFIWCWKKIFTFRTKSASASPALDCRSNTLNMLTHHDFRLGMVASFRQVVKAEGAGALMTGFGPTFAGYFLQGAFKFGGYEFWKIYLVSSGIAEFFADVALCPLEATRIRLVSQPTFATGLVSGFSRILKEDGVIRGFYSGFGPILLKQIPYTMAKFV
ncbi:mitochondrial phosphate carrier protein, partial [Lunasporangiospora selenospora]